MFSMPKSAKILLSFFVCATALSQSACGDDTCELTSGPWTCSMTISTATGNCQPGKVGTKFTWTYVLAESEDRECKSDTFNEGPTYDSATQIFTSYSGTMSGVDSDRIEGNVTYRFSSDPYGADSCAISGPVTCTPD